MKLEKEKIDLGIVVLHYNNIDDTIECVYSFLNKLDTKKYHILIFDNCSPNGSGELLKQKFKNIKNVSVYLNDKNIGFGAGNNKGLDILRDKYEANFIVLSNNDIILLDTNFYKKVETEYKQSNFAELGPLIVTADGRLDSNPIFDLPCTREIAEYNLKDYKSKLKSRKYHYSKFYDFIIRFRFKFSKSFRKKRLLRNRKYKSDAIFLKKRENVICHGCFMVFSKNFFKYYRGINLHSFMYDEEDIIFLQIISKGMKTIYCPSIAVYHKEGRSVMNTYRNNRKKQIFLYEKYIEAIEGYINYLDELEKGGFILERGV